MEWVLITMLTWMLIFLSVAVVFGYGLLLDDRWYVGLGYMFFMASTVVLWVALAIGLVET